MPVPHFGMALEVQQFHDLAARVKEAGIKFILDPHVRFEGTASPKPEAQACCSSTDEAGYQTAADCLTTLAAASGYRWPIFCDTLLSC